MLTFGSLFAGIGGLDVGLERAGMVCKWQVEIDDYARRVLAKHWPDVQRHDDVRTFPPGGIEQWGVGLICGGFPCQDISNAGKRAGITGARSGLWSEFARIVRLLRPRYVLVENVPALLGRGLDLVLGDLAEIGFDAEWDCISAAEAGAPHLRERLFIVAYPDRQRQQQPQGRQQEGRRWSGDCPSPANLDGQHGRTRGQRRSTSHSSRNAEQAQRQQMDADANRVNTEEPRVFKPKKRIKPSEWWAAEPAVVRMVHGVPHRVDRIRGLGNAVVPQVAEWIGRRILEWENQCSTST